MVDALIRTFRYPLRPTAAQEATLDAWRRTTYSRGATESQDERPWEYEKTVKATLVREVEKTVKVWEPA